MREIKFRAWNRRTKRMCLTRFYINRDGVVYLDSDPYGIDMSGKVRIYPTDTIIISQFTGLHDKNGKEIWEGDIVLEDCPRSNKYQIISVAGGFAVNTHPDDWNKTFIQFYTALADMQTASYLNESCEVIGNIYEMEIYLRKS
jgi:uncharacterized phage protein (TIGR01671 family)